VELRVGEQQGTTRELAVLLLGPEVDVGHQSMMRSMRKATGMDCTHLEVPLTGGSGCRWLLEGEWARPFGLGQWRTRCLGGGARW
jgi:hypothetical protein